MRLLLDEDSGSHELAKALRAVGHDVARVVDIAILKSGASDRRVLAFAISDARVLLTKNGSDFKEITGPGDFEIHPGILIHHHTSDGVALPIETIVRAIGNIEHSYDTTESVVLSINNYVWM